MADKLLPHTRRDFRTSYLDTHALRARRRRGEGGGGGGGMVDHKKASQAQMNRPG